MSQTVRIAVVIDLDWPLKRHQEPFSGIQDYARQHARHWDLVADMFPVPWIKSSSNSPGYDALFGRITKADADAAKRAGIPVVNIWTNSPVAKQVPSVLVDHHEAGRMAGEHLVARGIRRLGVMGYRRDKGTREYFGGIKSVADENSIPLSYQLANFSNRHNEKNWHKYLTDVGNWMDTWQTPIGVGSVYDNSARVLATMCKRRELKIPEDVAIIGRGDDPLHCEGTEPELSSIDAAHYRQGYEAAELLDKLLQGADPPTEPIYTPPAELLARMSTDVYAVADKTVGRAMRYIAEHCSEPIRVGDVVEHVGCDRRKLEKQFRESGRDTINNEIVALRLELTKRLLVSTDDAIQIVAMHAGFGTAQHMRHVFRHQIGMSPKAYREKHSQMQ